MLYFAYGSNMPTARLTARVPSAVHVDIGYLHCHTLCFHKVSVDGSGKCDAFHTGDRKDCIIGVIYRIAPAHKNELDRIEGLGWGYAEKEVTLKTPAAGKIRAFTYCAIKIDPGKKPYSWYIHHVVSGARENNLPQEYIEKILTIEAIEDPDPKRAERELKIYKSRRPCP